MEEIIYISSRSIERFLESHPYIPPKYPGHDGNIFVAPVTQLAAFRDLIVASKQVPSQQEFVEHYCQANEMTILQLSLPEQAGIQWRVGKAWASHIMEYHLMMLLIETREVEAAWQSEELDVKAGVDIVVQIEEHPIGVRAFYIHPSSLKDATAWQVVKSQRKAGVKLEFPVINFPLHPEEARVVGNIHLYTPALCNELLWEAHSELGDLDIWSERNLEAQRTIQGAVSAVEQAKARAQHLGVQKPCEFFPL